MTILIYLGQEIPQEIKNLLDKYTSVKKLINKIII